MNQVISHPLNTFFFNFIIQKELFVSKRNLTICNNSYQCLFKVAEHGLTKTESLYYVIHNNEIISSFED